MESTGGGSQGPMRRGGLVVIGISVAVAAAAITAVAVATSTAPSRRLVTASAPLPPVPSLLPTSLVPTSLVPTSLLPKVTAPAIPSTTTTTGPPAPDIPGAGVFNGLDLPTVAPSTGPAPAGDESAALAAAMPTAAQLGQDWYAYGPAQSVPGTAAGWGPCQSSAWAGDTGGAVAQFTADGTGEGTAGINLYQAAGTAAIQQQRQFTGSPAVIPCLQKVAAADSARYPWRDRWRRASSPRSRARSQSDRATMRN